MKKILSIVLIVVALAMLVFPWGYYTDKDVAGIYTDVRYTEQENGNITKLMGWGLSPLSLSYAELLNLKYSFFEFDADGSWKLTLKDVQALEALRILGLALAPLVLILLLALLLIKHLLLRRGKGIPTLVLYTGYTALFVGTSFTSANAGITFWPVVGVAALLLAVLLWRRSILGVI